MSALPRFPGTTLAEDRAFTAGELPTAQADANASIGRMLGRIADRVEAVAFEPTHPTLSWVDYFQTARVEKALLAAERAFTQAMGQTP